MTVALLAIRNSIHTVRWANSLAERGHDVTVISSQTGGDPLHEAVREHTLLIPAPLGYFLNVFELRSLLRRLQPDLLHAHFASGYGTLGRLSGDHPYLLSVWGRDVYEFHTRSSIHRRLLQSNLRAPDHVCSTSEVMVEQTRSVCEEVGPITVTPFGVDTEAFAPESDGTNDQDVIRVGTVKTLADKYGIDVLVEAVATVRDALQDAGAPEAERLRFLIVGGGPQAGELKQQVRDRRLENITTFTGQVPHEEVPHYLNKLDVYVAASREDSESFGVAILEASACACPVVVSNVGGLPEVVEEGRTGLVVPREDPFATAEAILELIRDPQLRTSMGEAGRSWVQDRYSWESCVDRMEAVYKNVTTQPGS
jgi:glycosyltransferase involved in cell wall biosynthesis